MRITGFRTFLVDAYRTNFIFFKLYTDAGVEGLGEATVEWNEKAVVAALEEVGEFLIGKDPFATDYLIQTMHRNSYWRTGVVLRSALKQRCWTSRARLLGSLCTSCWAASIAIRLRATGMAGSRAQKLQKISRTRPLKP